MCTWTFHILYADIILCVVNAREIKSGMSVFSSATVLMALSQVFPTELSHDGYNSVEKHGKSIQTKQCQICFKASLANKIVSTGFVFL